MLCLVELIQNKSRKGRKFKLLLFSALPWKHSCPRVAAPAAPWQTSIVVNFLPGQSEEILRLKKS